MTEERIAHLEALCREAMEGPWRTNGDAVICDGTNGDPITDAYYRGRLICESAEAYNAALMAEARTALPDLLAEVRRLRGILAKMDDLLEQDALDNPDPWSSLVQQLNLWVRDGLAEEVSP